MMFCSITAFVFQCFDAISWATEQASCQSSGITGGGEGGRQIAPGDIIQGVTAD